MPGLRIGWMVAAHDILEKAVMLKQTVDLQTSSFAQRQASYYIDMYDLDAHVNRSAPSMANAVRSCTIP